MKRTFYALCAASTLAFATPVLGQTITQNDANTTVTFNGPAGTTESSTLQLTLQSFTGGVATYQYVFTNSAPSLGNLVGFAFSTDPLLQSVTDGTLGSYTALDFYKDINSNYPGGFVIDACATSGNNCQAANGQADQFGGTFALNFGAGTTSYTLSGFVARYASLTQLNGGSGEGTWTPPVPEPGTWAMMLLGFAGIGMTVRRRRTGQVLAQVA